eukprot:768599-Hanusia_phi.AAC.1
MARPQRPVSAGTVPAAAGIGPGLCHVSVSGPGPGTSLAAPAIQSGFNSKSPACQAWTGPRGSGRRGKQSNGWRLRNLRGEG